MNIKHLHLHTRDRVAAERFYTDWLGLDLKSHGDSISFMTDGLGFDLALMDDAAPAKMPPWFHFGSRLESSDAVVALHDRMREASVPIVRPLYRDDTIVSFRFADPDGYAVEIYWEAS